MLRDLFSPVMGGIPAILSTDTLREQRVTVPPPAPGDGTLSRSALLRSEPTPFAGLAEPGGADTVLTLDEDGSHVFVLADFGFDDGGEGDLLAGVIITTLPGSGTLTLDADGAGGDDPVEVLAGQTISAADIDAGLLVYTPYANEHGAGYASFTFQVQDDGGGDDLDPDPNTISFDVTAINDAPELDLDPFEPGNDAVLSWSEGDGPVALAYFATFNDDNDSYDGATVTAAFSANGTADDRLTILSVGDGPGEIRIDGSDVYYEGTLVGSFTGGTDGSTPLVITFNADACHCAVELTIASIAFSNLSDAPELDDRTVTITLVDGGGTAGGGFDTASADIVVSVSAGNDAPTVDIDAPIIASGGQVQVNTTTIGAQQDPKIAALEDGGYVVLWSSTYADLSDVSISGQIYDADGTPRGGEFVIDTLGEFDFTNLSVSGLDGGGFVVAWQDVAPGFGRYVAAQRFDAYGDPMGIAVQVTGTGAGGSPVVTALNGGGYVVAWLSFGDGYDVSAQLFDASDMPVGSSFILSSATVGTQNFQAVAGLADGGFVATWTSFDADSSFTEVFAQRFDASGTPVGGEFLVPTATTGDQLDASVTGLANGGFVIAWVQSPSFGDVNVSARLYDASGNPLGNEFAVTTPSWLRQGNPTVTALADGGFLISWQAVDSGSYGGVRAQRYDANGAEVGGEYVVSDDTRVRHSQVSVGLADGGFAIAWVSIGEDGSGPGIFARAYAATLDATEQVSLDLKGRIAIGDADAGADIITVTLSVTEGVLAIDPGTTGVSVDDSDPQTVILTGTLAELQALLGSGPDGSVTYTYDDDYPPFWNIELEVSIDDGFEQVSDIVTIAVTPVNDAAELDLDFMTPGNDAVATYFWGDPATPISYNATFDDDNTDWDGATLTIAISGATSDDQLAIDDTLLFDVTIDGNNILYQGDIVGTWSGGGNGAPLVVTFNADACACAVEEVAYGIVYSNTASNPAPGTRDVTFTFVDGDGTANGGHDTATATVALTVTPGATPPVIDAGATATGNEDSAIVLTGITITDEGDPLTGLVTVHLGVAHGTLAIRTDVPGGIDASSIVNNATGRGISIVATPAQINATLAAGGLVYQGDADFNGSDALTLSVHDGTPDSALALSSLGAQVFDFPSAVAFADVDGDQLDDLVLGIGDGTGISGILVLSSGFGGAVLPSGTADAFAFADFDGDAILDIGFASYAEDGSGYVGYVSSIDGEVEVIANVPNALDLATGDFNGDGLADIAVADSDSGRIAILLQTAPGAFAPPVYSATTSLLTVSIRTADFNRDGVLDLLASNYGTAIGFAPPGSVDLFLGNGDGTFGAATQVWTAPSNADGLVIADFNNDGFADFAFASVDEAGVPGGVNGVQVVLGNGDGSFGAATGYATTASGTGRPTRVQAGDLNGDGIADLVVTNFDLPGTFSILVGNGNGSFQAPVDFDTGGRPYVVALGDPDGDGDLDLMIGNAADGSYEAFNNDGFHRGTTATKTITVNAVNDAPSGIDGTATMDEDSTHVFTIADFGFDDVEGNAFGGINIVSLPTSGTLFFDADGAGGNAPVALTEGRIVMAAAIAAGKLSYAPAPNGNGVGYASFTFQVRDGGGTANGGVAFDPTPATLTIDVNPTQDVPAGDIAVVGIPSAYQTLTADTAGLADVDGLGTLHYQWQRDAGGGFVDVGGDAATYVLGAADIGAAIRVVVSYTDGGGTPETVTSAVTAPVAFVRATETIFDTGNTAPWTSQTTFYDAYDSIARQEILLDDGTTWINTFDTTDASPILWSTEHRDSNGNLVQRTVAYDDGTNSLSVYDVQDAYDWAEATMTFDRFWHTTALTGAMDDGSPVTSLADVPGAMGLLLWITDPFDPDYNGTASNATLHGGAAGDMLYGFGGNDTLDGRGGDDLLFGGRGSDRLTGGAGDDRFYFRAGDGFDTITDFVAGNASGDMIDLRGYGIANYAALLPRMSQVGSDTVIALGAGDQLTLENVTIGQLNAGDFNFW